ncbi:MAG: WD40 repeat domain-containing protein [Chitinophagaceae bacterium]
MKDGSSDGSGGFPFQIDEFYLDLQEDGSKISILPAVEIARRPFPGLRPFKTSEFQLFNGRVGQAEELIKRLKRNRFLAVIGSSGTGKSSLVRAGLIPQLFGGYLHGAGSKWNIAICRPGKDPVENLAIALASIKSHTKESKDLKEAFTNFESLLGNSIYGLLDAKELLDTDNSTNDAEKAGSNLLIIIDQFEELFRFDRKNLGKENIENQFVNLLLKAALDPGNAIYVIITMRSEFLGDCVKYRGLPEAINDGQYLVPQLTRGQLKEVIENPVRLAGKKIAPELVELLVNEIEESKLRDNLDQLPILQHALMRTYNEAMKEGPDVEINYEHYRRTGEMDKALANHAEAKFKELGDGGPDEKKLSKKQQVAKIIFQSLTDLGTDQKGGRRPTELRNIYAIAASLHASETEINEVVNHFRDSETSFIMPPVNTGLYPGLIIDISHESLMRNWTRLNEWIVEEMKLGNLYRRLNERRELHEVDNEEWLRGLLLRDLNEWGDNQSKNAIWASRYHQLPKKSNDPALHEALFQKNVQFLKNSIVKNKEIKAAEELEIKKDIAREQRDKFTKKVVRVLSLAVAVSFLFGLWAFAERNNARDQRKIAEQNVSIADEQKKIANSNAAEARKNFDSATVQRQIAEIQRKKADSSAAIAFRQSIELKKYADAAGEQKNIALQLRDNEQSQKENFKKQLVKNALKNQVFYFSNSLDRPAKEAIIDSLLKTVAVDTAQFQLAQYIDTFLLNRINDAVRIKENAAEEPAKSLADAKNLWGVCKHPVLKKILAGIVNDNLFPKQTFDITRNINLNKANLVVAGNGNGFAFNNGNQVVAGKVDNGRLLISENSFDDQFNRFFCGIKDSVSTDKNIVFLNYNDSNNIVAVIDSFRIEMSTDGEINSVGKMPRFVNAKSTEPISPDQIGYSLFQLSPDGRQVFLIDKDENVLLMRASGERNGSKPDTIGNYRNISLSNESMSFSADSRYKLLNGGGKMKVVGANNKIIIISYWDDEYIDAACFTPDSRSIIVIADGKMSVRDTLLNKYPLLQQIDLNNSFFTGAGILAEKIRSIKFTKDLSRMLIEQKNEKIFLLETRNSDSIFRRSENGYNNLLVKQIGNSKNKSRSAFYNDSTVITIQDGGTVSLWNIHADFANPEQAIEMVYPEKPFKEKLQDSALTFGGILSSGNTAELNSAADYYYRNEKPELAKAIYQKLLDKAQPDMRGHYLNKLLLINVELNNLDRIYYKLDAKRQTTDTVQAYRVIKMNRLKENVAISEEQGRLCSNKARDNKSLSKLYGSLSFNQLFAGDFNGAVQSAASGLKLYPDEDWIYTNLALGYLLSGKYVTAENIYKKYKDKWFANKTQSFKSAFLDDIRELEDAGVIASQREFAVDVARIKKLLQ